MLRNSEGSGQRRRGRPPKDITDCFRACAWYYAVKTRSHGASAYALEKQFSARRRAPDEPWISTGNWRQYRRGRRVPDDDLALRVEAVYPRTRVWLELPFWEMIRVPAPSFERVHALMAALRPDIAELLFFRYSLGGGRLERRTGGLTEPYAELDRKSDIEALTAAIGLIREAEYQGNEYQHCQGAITALRIFLRLAKFTPLSDIAPVLLEYLNMCFFRSEYEHVPRRGPAFNGVDLQTETLIRDSIVLMLEDFEVLPVEHATRRACLYLADVYGLGKAARELHDLYHSADWKRVKSARVVKWFVRRLRSFELTKSCLD